jgi:hypothetical protein
MSKRRKWITKALVAIPAIALMTIVPASSAQAKNPPCKDYYNGTTHKVHVCVQFDQFGGNPRADAFYTTISTYPPTYFWAGLYQCSGTGSDCQNISANSKWKTVNPPPSAAYEVTTSSKPYSFGHTYKACTSIRNTFGTLFVFACSDPTY